MDSFASLRMTKVYKHKKINMKKLLLLSLLFFTLPAKALIVNDWNGMCGVYKYDTIYASFEPISYTCAVNTYLPKQTTGCAACPSGFDCDGGTFAYSERYDQGLTPHTITCQSGKFLPANSETCMNCPSGYTCSGGTFSVNRTEYQGLTKNSTYMLGDENGVCASNYGHKIYSVWQAIPYTCASGQFLPAASTTCAACPADYSCSGGTFYFNAKNNQGLSNQTTFTNNLTNVCATNAPHGFIATYEINSYNCATGYYLPADEIECTICPTDSICSGGTYTYNATIDQGIQSCANGTFAPTGSAVCYPHILHVGDSNVYLKSTKQTTPSLNIKIGNDIFYANMTTTQTKMNKDSTHYFRAKTADNIYYYICDDTTCPQ